MDECSSCGLMKTLDNTNVDNSRLGGLSKYCKVCLKARRSTPEDILKRKIKQKGYYLKNKEKLLKNSREYSIKRKFNLTEEEYLSKLKDQNHSCLICGVHESRLSKKLAVDHCHKTGKVRGLLCFSCNVSLGRFKDSKELLQKAINYLEEYN